MIANETSLNKRPNDTEINSYNHENCTPNMGVKHKTYIYIYISDGDDSQL